MPHIYGNRIRLRAPERSDIPRFVQWLNDPEVTAGLLVRNPMSQADEEGWFERMLGRPAEEHPMVIEVRQADSSSPADVKWVPIGNCSFMKFDWRSRSSEIGIFIGEKTLWNQGYGTEVMQLLLEHGFHTLNLNRIWLRVHADNLRAIRCYEKAGFVHEGRLRDEQFKHGQYVDTLVMSVLEKEYHG